MRRLPAFALALALAAVPATAPPPAAAQQGTAPETGSDPNWPPGLERWHDPQPSPPGDPDEAEERGLTSPEVERSQMPEPTPQGTRPPEPTEDTTRAEDMELYEALALVRRAPPALDGRPVARPNPLASEPGTEMEPHPAGNPESLFPENYVE